ncbi:protein CEBPZOS [Phlebotomus papatasi]|nr:protein CEBPZOS [Phlebotomus papatasi]
MIRKSEKSPVWKIIKRGIGIGIAAEVAFLVGSYAVWHRMNTNSDFRKYMHENYPYFLEGFYRVGELLGKGAEIRQLDATQWNNRSEVKKDW